MAKQAKLHLVNAIRQAKKAAWEELCAMVDSDPWGKPYKLVMSRLGPRRPISGLNTPGRIESIVDCLFPVHPDGVRREWPLEEPVLPVTDAEVQLIAKRIPGNKTPDPDGIPGEALKLLAQTRPATLTRIFNTCLTQGKFPAMWKRARLDLLRKGSRPLEDPASYRPLCMLDATGKFLEKIVDSRLKAICDANSLLTDNQYGLRCGRSTIDAISLVLTIVEVSLRAKTMVGVLLFDVKNAFNSAPWDVISAPLQAKGVPGYLCRLLSDYFDERVLIYEVAGEIRTRRLFAGVPQGSVLGPTLWNFLYDGLLRLPMPEGVELVAYADDIAVVAQAAVIFKVGELLEEAAEIVVNWLAAIGIELTVEKTELVIPTRKRKHNTLNVTIKGQSISSKPSVRYLGIHFDQRVNFGAHALYVAQKADSTTRFLRAIMPNLGGPRSRSRRLLSSVPHSMMLYGAPIWARNMSASGLKALAKCQRQIALWVATAHRTISGDALLVIAGIPPIDMLATERAHIYDGK